MRNRIDFSFACLDHCLAEIVPSDLRKLVLERDKAESSLSAAVKALSRYANRENWEKSYDSGKRDWWLATTHGHELATKFFADHPELRGK
jgi:hypothetical protein